MSSNTNASSMEELLAKSGYKPQILKKGEQVTGTVIAITSKEIRVDLHSKAEGIVLEKDRKLFNELSSRLKVGDSVTATVLSPESDSGNVVLSLRREMMEQTWTTLANKKENDEELEVTGIEVTRGGILVDVLGLRGFVPLSQLDVEHGARPDSLVGSTFKAKVLDLDRKEKRIVLTQKGAKVDSKKMKAAFEQLEVGKEYEGVVTGITSFGVFVKLTILDQEIEGLVHISELSWEKVENIDKMFKVGDKMRVMAIAVDRENFKLNLSLKKLTQDPWEKVAAKFTKEQTVSGKVSKISSFGVFVTLSEGVEGLIHKTKLPVDTPYKVGQEIECVVESVDSEKRRIALAPLLKEKPVNYR